ncbi:hypothetical protein HU200_038525 [Digitaria exilis]|uniref:DUF4220 domain-containing protein n=1 Tax=Digitaria exilis TaxID=1010633 RepID=A0A835BCF9_9POAL|nr:hypothetical protein HU200_038525 [Digitaria exilis]
MLTGLLTGAYNLGSEWVIRFVVTFSLGAHVYLALFTGIRRRQAYGPQVVFLWLAYQFLDWAAPYVLSNLSLGSKSTELQLVTLWLPCMVTYRAGPDNLTAYSFEDTEISMRQYVSASLQVGTILYVLANQIVTMASKGALFWASVVMVMVGVFKYVERVYALREGNFGNIRSSGKKKQPILRVQPRGRGKLLGNEQALLLAHQLLGIAKHAFADYSVQDGELKLKEDSNLEDIFYVEWKNDSGWDNMCKVVEMELSLMYDILYTKAAVIHNWFGCSIRVISPMVTATVILLFWFYSKDDQRTADVIITYILLAVTLLLDVRWLLGAAASTWTYAFFNASPGRWLHHEVCCTVWWHRLRHFVVSLDPWQLPLRDHGGGYRLWSATIGQYNLFYEATHNTTSRCSRLLEKLSLEETWKEYYYSRRLKLHKSKHVKVLLFAQIQKALNVEPSAPPKEKKEKEEKPPPPPPTEAPALRRHRELDEDLGFLSEFQELILIWHVTTDVFLFCSYKQRTDDHEEEKYAKAIKAVSDYMAFLAAVPPDMLPGLKLRSLHQATLQVLKEFWKSPTTNPSVTTGDWKEKLLIEIL